MVIILILIVKIKVSQFDPNKMVTFSPDKIPKLNLEMQKQLWVWVITAGGWVHTGQLPLVSPIKLAGCGLDLEQYLTVSEHIFAQEYRLRTACYWRAVQTIFFSVIGLFNLFVSCLDHNLNCHKHMLLKVQYHCIFPWHCSSWLNVSRSSWLQSNLNCCCLS